MVVEFNSTTGGPPTYTTDTAGNLIGWSVPFPFLERSIRLDASSAVDNRYAASALRLQST